MFRIRHALAAAAALAAATTTLPAQQGANAGPVIVAQPATTLPLKHVPRPTVPAISAADLMTRLYIFADDSMQGREAGTAGNVKGTNYLADQARQIGLVPAGDNGTYFQTIPLKQRVTDPTSTFSAGGSALKFGTDWAVNAGTKAAVDGATAVWGGSMADSAGMLPRAQAGGKVVVFPLANGGDLRSLTRGDGPRPAAVALVVPDMYIAYFAQPSQFVDDAPATPDSVTVPILLVSAGAAARLFDSPVAQLAPGAAGKAVTLHLTVTTDPVPFPARNVVGILPGSDPALRGEYVAIGAHNDHVGFNQHPVDHDSLRIFNHIARAQGADSRGGPPSAEQVAEVNRELAAWRAAHPGTSRADSIANGADDDGSGSVTVLEIAQQLASMSPRPKRSILFVWHVGEEKGLLGSAYFTDHPTVPRDSIVAQLNMDMVGRGDAWDVAAVTKDGQYVHGNPNYLQLVGSRRLSTELGNLVEQVNRDGGHNLDFDYSMDADGHPSNIYCRSDHYEYARYGIPITFFTTGLHSDYHQVTDEPQYIDYSHMARVGSLVADVAVHVANLNHRVVVDHAKPDPKGSCKQ